jgi:hypothetical protein
MRVRARKTKWYVLKELSSGFRKPKNPVESAIDPVLEKQLCRSLWCHMISKGIKQDRQTCRTRFIPSDAKDFPAPGVQILCIFTTKS